MSLYLQDGSASGHASWCEEAIRNDLAAGAIISPFFTPNVHRKAAPSGDELASRVRDAGGSVIFDATTHGALLPGVNHWNFYSTWDLWGGPRGDLADRSDREEHVNRVFGHQDRLQTPHLCPTAPLDSPIGADADIALAMAEDAQGLDPSTWQSLAGRRGFWLSENLDGYVGALAQLGAPVWLLTVIRESGEYPPNLEDAILTGAVCRTVDSLSRRARVIVCHADLYGLPMIAAGAEAIGTGWHNKQRVCSPQSYQQNDASPRRSADWMTYQGLLSRLHKKNASDVLLKQERATAQALYGGPLAATTTDSRYHPHHLGVVRALTEQVAAPGHDRAARVQTLRDGYEAASAEFARLSSRYRGTFATDRTVQVARPYEGLKAYAEAEGLWI